MDEVVDRNSLALLKKVTSHQLYDALLLQLRKDFKVANVNLVFKDQAKPNEVVRELYHTINHLILHRFNDYLNLLYAVDVPENEMTAGKVFLRLKMEN